MAKASEGETPTTIACNWLTHLSPSQVSNKISALRKAGLIKTTTTSMAANKEKGNIYL